MKNKITDTNSEMYMKLIDNNDIVKQDLNRYLEDKEKNKALETSKVAQQILAISSKES